MKDSEFFAPTKGVLAYIQLILYFNPFRPSIADDLLAEAEVLAWLKKNRFKNMELDLFMYSILAVAVTFVLYTAFLLFGFKPRDSRGHRRTEGEEENEDDVVGKKNK